MRVMSMVCFLVCLGTASVAVADTYTIDQREYVSGSQSPYSSVVQFKQGNTGYCSGVLTTDGFVVTAKHCIVDKQNNPMSASRLTVVHPVHGRLKLRDNLRTSTADIRDMSQISEDWALIGVDQPPTSDVRVALLGGTNPTRVQVVGHGALKILSDQEIKKIRQAYMTFLRQNNAWTPFNPRNNLVSGRDIYTRSQAGYRFVIAVGNGQIPDVDSDTFSDMARMKMSRCQAQPQDNIYGENLNGCQLWGGNSGGPVLKEIDGKWYLYGITVTGLPYVALEPSLNAHGVHMVYVNKIWDMYNLMLDWRRYNMSIRPQSTKNYKSAF